MIDVFHAQVAFTTALLRKVHRTFMWPDTVDIVQKRLNATDNLTILEHQEHQLGIRAIRGTLHKRPNYQPSKAIILPT
jgi:hypothetical protein